MLFVVFGSMLELCEQCLATSRYVLRSDRCDSSTSSSLDTLLEVQLDGKKAFVTDHWSWVKKDLLVFSEPATCRIFSFSPL